MSDTVEFPRAWIFHSDDAEKPADGPVFVGRFTGVIEEGTTSYGPTPVARFVHEDTKVEYSIWLFNQALKDRLSKLAPETDELVQINYRGRKKSKTSKFSYQSFDAVAPERPVQALSWGALAAHDEDEDDE